MKKLAFTLLLPTLVFGACTTVASNPETVGEILCNIKLNTFQGVFKLIFAASYVSGVFMIVAAIFKLKQVKDNPTQIPVTTPIVLFLCAALMIYLPELIVPAGESIFGSGEVGQYDTVSDQAKNTSSIRVRKIQNLLDE